MGARYIYRQDFRENAIGGLRGGGPELVYFLGNYRDPVSPVRERRIPSDPGNQHRPTPGRRGDCQPEIGLNIAMSNSVACCRPDTFSDRMSSPPGEPLVGKAIGFGIGLTASIY